MQFEEEYFSHLNYSKKGQLIARHVVETLKWASRTVNQNLLDGSGKSALDVGCAFGYGISALSALGYDAIGTDISSYGQIQAKEHSSNDYVICDAQTSLPFNKQFDLVTSFEVLEHLENPARTLRNLYDSSKAVVVCTTPNKRVEQIFKKIAPGFDKTHINVKTPSEWRKLVLEKTDCSRVEVECFMDSSFQLFNTSFYKSLKLPFGMETRIVITR